MHQFDARSKIFLLLLYSISLFLVDSLFGLIIDAILLFALIRLSDIALSRFLKPIIPIYAICFFILLFNAFSFASADMQYPNRSLDLFMPLPDADARSISDTDLYLGGAFHISCFGFFLGVFFAVRILLLTWASLLMCYTTTSNELRDAFIYCLRPLRAIKVPVDDVATIFSIALRFIPLTVEEFFSIRDAQWSRGGKFDEGGFILRIKAHFSIFVPMIVGLFRRSDKLALAMDVRCYALADSPRTVLLPNRASKSFLFATLALSALIAAIALLF